MHSVDADQQNSFDVAVVAFIALGDCGTRPTGS